MAFLNSDLDNAKSLQIRRDLNGKMFVKAYSSAGVALKAFAQIAVNGDGYKAETVSSSGGITSFAMYCGVADEAVGTGSNGWFQIGGLTENAQGATAGFTGSKGHAVAWSITEVFANSSEYTGAANHIGTLAETVSGSTTANIFLLGKLSAGKTAR